VIDYELDRGSILGRENFSLRSQVHIGFLNNETYPIGSFPEENVAAA
jgi:hypothetical protein